MIIVKKIDNKTKKVTVSNNGKLQDMKLSEFLTKPKVEDIVEAQTDENGKSKMVVINEKEINSPVVEGKSKIVAGLLGMFLGGLGIHNFYLGNTGKGIAQLLLTVFGWILIVGPFVSALWAFIEAILILTSKKGGEWHQDANGRELID